MMTAFCSVMKKDRFIMKKLFVLFALSISILGCDTKDKIRRAMKTTCVLDCVLANSKNIPNPNDWPNWTKADCNQIRAIIKEACTDVCTPKDEN